MEKHQKGRRNSRQDRGDGVSEIPLSARPLSSQLFGNISKICKILTKFRVFIDAVNDTNVMRLLSEPNIYLFFFFENQALQSQRSFPSNVLQRNSFWVIGFGGCVYVWKWWMRGSWDHQCNSVYQVCHGGREVSPEKGARGHNLNLSGCRYPWSEGLWRTPEVCWLLSPFRSMFSCGPQRCFWKGLSQFWCSLWIRWFLGLLIGLECYSNIWHLNSS